MSESQGDDDGLEDLLGAGSLIGRAIVALRNELNADEEEAFSRLVELADASGCRLREAAADVLRESPTS